MQIILVNYKFPASSLFNISNNGSSQSDIPWTDYENYEGYKLYGMAGYIIYGAQLALMGFGCNYNNGEGNIYPRITLKNNETSEKTISLIAYFLRKYN